MQVNIDELIEKLNNNLHVKVQFLTKSGTVRVMSCTRRATEPGINNPKLNGPDIIAVFDLLVNEWRAFRKDSVQNFTVINHQTNLYQG